MKPASAPVLTALRHVRKASAGVAALCDSILLGRRMDANEAMSLLPAALARLSHRTQAALEALEKRR
jgi:hypothetical protein